VKNTSPSLMGTSKPIGGGGVVEMTPFLETHDHFRTEENNQVSEATPPFPIGENLPAWRENQGETSIIRQVIQETLFQFLRKSISGR